jgi:hypothetical protein
MMRSRARLLAAGVVVCVGVLASACGGPSTPGVASLAKNPSHSSTGTSGGSKQPGFLSFAKCMRSHGVKNFPESKGLQVGPGSGIDPTSPSFQAAQRACASFLPKPTPAKVKAAEKNALKFSECMRKHGETNFPDPQFSASGGNISIRLGGPGVNLNPTSPTYQAAQRACQKDLHLPKGAPGKHSGAVAVP